MKIKYMIFATLCFGLFALILIVPSLAVAAPNLLQCQLSQWESKGKTNIEFYIRRELNGRTVLVPIRDRKPIFEEAGKEIKDIARYIPPWTIYTGDYILELRTAPLGGVYFEMSRDEKPILSAEIMPNSTLRFSDTENDMNFQIQCSAK